MLICFRGLPELIKQFLISNKSMTKGNFRIQHGLSSAFEIYYKDKLILEYSRKNDGRLYCWLFGRNAIEQSKKLFNILIDVSYRFKTSMMHMEHLGGFLAYHNKSDEIIYITEKDLLNPLG